MRRGSSGSSSAAGGSSKGALQCTVKLLDGSNFQLEVNVSLSRKQGVKFHEPAGARVLLRYQVVVACNWMQGKVIPSGYRSSYGDTLLIIGNSYHSIGLVL